ncbi:membrane-anchored protein OsmC family [Nitratireductor pacificus pht-3B]|uniref:Membrane-anchored protein OsmC family n=2 Tax=Nitratireductor TaxID=245876 RepID=K2M9M9_9HYPH|nr:membrane-anchored protein OsmC family [Nitratireductor pacificus pht-3B]
MQWRMTAQLSQGGELRLDLAGNGPDAGGATDAWTPVDFLAAAVAGCFVKSCQMVLQALGEAERHIEAHVELDKADAKPNRVGRARIRYMIDGLDADRAARIAKDAKRICTVTNTLNCEFELAI